MRRMALLVSVLWWGCESEYVVRSEQREITCCSKAPPPTPTPPSTLTATSGAALYPTGYGSSVMVLQSRHLDRATEVLGILDIHLPVGGQDAALAELRAQAAAMGADAVVGAEFHHGEGQGEPIHVSGMAVRFIQLAPS